MAKRSLVIALLMAGCGDDSRPTFDGGRSDSGRVDGGTRDDGGPRPDGGGVDAGDEDEDAGGEDDAGGDLDAGMPTGSAAIRLVLDAAPGPIDPPIHVEGVTVTYVRPLIGTDPAGFFVQAEAAGPALFVAVDAATLTPVPAPGDSVAFDVTETAEVTGQHRVTMLTGFARTATGGDPSALAQDASAVDLVAMLDDYESELITLTATIAGDFSSCSPPHRCAQITTAGVATASTSLRFRTLDTIETSLGLRDGCEIEIDATPLWRFNTAAQPSAWDEAEVTVLSCPPLPAPGEGDVVIAEIAHAFEGPDGELEWIEITNPSTTDTFDLAGCTIEDSGAAPHTIAGALEVGPGASVVLAGPMADLTPDYTFPASIFGISDTADSLTLTCGGVVVDTLAWPGAGGFPAATNGVSWQLAPGATTAMANDMGANWCASPSTATYGMPASMLRGSPGATNPMCEVVSCPPPTHLVINEIDYDQPMADTAEFVEIHNPTAADIALTGLSLVFFNGSDDTEYDRFDLSGTLAAGAYAVVAPTGFTVPAGVMLFELPFSIQNGAPDAVGLVDTAGPTFVDFLAYEGANATVIFDGSPTMFTVAEGMTSPGAIDDGAVGSLSRVPNACDRDTPAMDWAFTAMMTPGAAN